MTLVYCYTVFGTELLKESIKQIYNHVDEIIICWQRTSNTGKVDDSLFDKLKAIKEPLKGKNIWLIEYIPDLNLSTKENERRKHQHIINVARGIGATHFVLSAVDHFYEPEQFQYGKLKAVDYNVTFTGMFTYYKYPSWQLFPLEDYYMPFICKITPETQIINTTKYPLKTDPSVRIGPYKKWYLFKQDEVIMHHFSMVRQNLKAKFDSSASAYRWEEGRVESYLKECENYDLEVNPGVSYFKGRKVKVVDNIFGL